MNRKGPEYLLEANELEKRIQFLEEFLDLILTNTSVVSEAEKSRYSTTLGDYLIQEPNLPPVNWNFDLIESLNNGPMYLFDNRLGKASAKRSLPYFLVHLQGKLQAVKTKPITAHYENSIELKVPTESITDVQQYLKDYRNALEPLIIDDEIKGEMELIDCRSGSVWLEFLTKSSEAVTLIGAVVYAAYYIINKKKRVQFSEEQIKLFQITNELQQTYAEALKLELNKLIEIEAQALCKKHLKKTDNEKIAQVRTSIKLLAGLFEKGGQVIAGPGATQQQKESFPDLKNLQNLVSMVKQIEGGAENKTEE